MTDKTLGAYQRHEKHDYADGDVTAAMIEEEDGVDAAASRLAAFARKFGVPPEWTIAPAVQAWHRSDHRTEYDGTPGQPRIWSRDYRTAETWSTPSLRNVHWSDLVDVTPLAPVRECPDPEQHDIAELALNSAGLAAHFRDKRDMERARAEKAEDTLSLVQQQRDQANARAERAEAELDSWMTRAYEAEQRAWRAEARIKAVLAAVQEWESTAVRYDVAPIMRAASTRIRRALEE